MIKAPLFYKAPKDLDNNPYWVPIVAKNKDALIGFLNGVYFTTEQLEVESDTFLTVLGSDRFNDILKDGTRVRDIADADFKKYIKKVIVSDIVQNMLKDNNDECGPELMDDFFLPLSCTCGNFFGFRTPSDIPSKPHKCELCGKVVIDYTNTNDDEFDYDGAEKDLNAIIDEVRGELNITGDEDEQGPNF